MHVETVRRLRCGRCSDTDEVVLDAKLGADDPAQPSPDGWVEVEIPTGKDSDEPELTAVSLCKRCTKSLRAWFNHVEAMRRTFPAGAYVRAPL